MRDHSNHIELSREEAVDQMLSRCDFEALGRRRVERIALAEAYGRVLAEDVRAASSVPSCLTCGMDSIAVHWSDFEGLEPGCLPDTSEWVRGRDWQFANTGVAMPEGFDTAIVIEHVQVSEDEQHVSIDAAPSRQFAGTRPAGSTLEAGDVLAHAGDVVTPDIAARIASGNASSVLVVAKPRVAFIPTGNELVPAGIPPVPSGKGRYAAYGKNFETNGYVVRGKVEKWGGAFMPFDIVVDDPDCIRAAIRCACEVADIVVLNAGSSKGSDDWSCEVMEEMGDVICHQTNHGPGHHSSYALVDGVPIVGISGPSGGASFTLNFYLRPLMMKWLGLPTEPQRIPVRLAEAFPQGGPGGHKPKPGQPLPGEARPPEATGKGAAFYGIRFLSIAAGEDGVLTGTPVAGRPGSAAAECANAYYMMPMGGGITPPQAGDVIYVELR